MQGVGSHLGIKPITCRYPIVTADKVKGEISYQEYYCLAQIHDLMYVRKSKETGATTAACLLSSKATKAKAAAVQRTMPNGCQEAVTARG